MSESVKLGGTSESGGQGRKGQMVGRGSAPPSKKAAAQDAPSAPAVPGQSKSVTSSAGGKHAYARSKLGEINAHAEGMRNEKQLPNAFQLPPVVTEKFARTGDFMKKVFNPQTLLDPLPGPLKTSLSRNFGFFTRIFTQFTDPQQKKQMKQSIGLGK